ncbi:MAG: hypothetical protein HYU41_27445 [Candidatus Rokubacteria bacterium]|nr:hypothetical protein [Candidatus Rokubacteria bacterium]
MERPEREVIVLRDTGRRWWIAGVALLVLVFMSAGAMAALREMRPTLDPARFVGKAAVTHRIAREIPAVLDQLYCYCECDKSVGHKSLLSCYTDGHAAT